MHALPSEPTADIRIALYRMKDIIYGFNTNNVYVVLECLDCDLRDLLDRCEDVNNTCNVKVCLCMVFSCKQVYCMQLQIIQVTCA